MHLPTTLAGWHLTWSGKPMHHWMQHHNRSHPASTQNKPAACRARSRLKISVSLLIAPACAIFLMVFATMPGSTPALIAGEQLTRARFKPSAWAHARNKKLLPDFCNRMAKKQSWPKVCGALRNMAPTVAGASLSRL